MFQSLYQWLYKFEYTKNYCVIPLKWVNCISIKLQYFFEVPTLSLLKPDHLSSDSSCHQKPEHFLTSSEAFENYVPCVKIQVHLCAQFTVPWPTRINESEAQGEVTEAWAVTSTSRQEMQLSSTLPWKTDDPTQLSNPSDTSKVCLRFDLFGFRGFFPI